MSTGDRGAPMRRICEWEEMQNERHVYRTSVLLATLAATTALVWFCAWFAGLCINPGTWPVRYSLLGVGFAITACCCYLWMRQLHVEQRAAQGFFDVLSRIDVQELAVGVESIDLPELPESNPWFDSAQRLQHAFIESSRRTQDANHARASLETKVRRMKANFEQVRDIVDGLKEPVVAIDNFDELILANQSAKTLLGLDCEILDTEERALATLVHCEQLVDLLVDTRRRKTPTQRSAEVKIGPTADDAQWYNITTNSIACAIQAPGDDSRMHGAVAVLRDVSGHKAAQKRNAEFVSSVSHEMKTPLAGIKAYVELLADGDAEDEQTREEFLNVINSQTDRLQRLIDNLLNLARIEAGVVNVSKQSRSLNEVLEESFHVVAPSAEAKQITLESELSPLYLGALIDRDMILQSAINLLSNAIKYTPEGGTVRLRSRMLDNEVEFDVEDTGVGLNEQDSQRVFEKFYRVKKDSKMAQGTGLGLPLAKHIVEDVHGGRLTVKSEVGKGSTFAVRLPRAAGKK